MGEAAIDFVKRAVLWRRHGNPIQNSGKPVACNVSFLPKRAGEENLFGEILGFEEVVRRWSGEFIGRGKRSVVCLHLLKNNFS